MTPESRGSEKTLSRELERLVEKMKLDEQLKGRHLQGVLDALCDAQPGSELERDIVEAVIIGVCREAVREAVHAADPYSDRPIANDYQQGRRDAAEDVAALIGEQPGPRPQYTKHSKGL